MNIKKIIFVLVLTLGILLCALYFFMKPANIHLSDGSSTPMIGVTDVPTATPPPIDPTIAAIPAQGTGGNMNVTLTTREQSHNELFFKIPLDMQNFIVDFDYAENKFSVLILNDAGEAAYHKWRKESYPLLTDDQFVLNDKRI